MRRRRYESPALIEVLSYVLGLALLLFAFSQAMGCVAIDARPDRVRAMVVGQAAAAAGCPATARPEAGGTAEAGDGGQNAGSPCVAIQGGPISSNLGTALGTIGGVVAGWLLR